ncbi:glycosyltransferase family 2 protein [Candidatus Pacearchaeota archaeon]|nr:glycosyltransferase family 2 protein [Candidatus Pacearchaeota archaeon]
MEKNPIVSVNLPTYNGEKTIDRALKSVLEQTYKNYEIIVVDHYSKDNTIKIARKYTDKIFFDKKRILNSRKIGLEKSSGEIILFLSCDQVLSKDLLERTVKLFRNSHVDMVINEERAFEPRTIVEKMTDLDRKIVHQLRETNPSKSVLLPSTYKKEILKEVLEKINDKILSEVTIHEHAIIYYEAYKISKRVGYLDNAVFHEEPKTIWELFHHYFMWGRRARRSKKIISSEYHNMFESKLANRLRSINLFNLEVIPTLPITFLKGSGYKLGYYFG